jgi:predicted kinase
VLLVGPPASGKSTLAAALVAVGVVDAHDVLTADRYRARLTGDAADLRSDRRVWPLLRLHLQERLALGHTTVVDATNLAPAKRARHLRVAHALGRPVVAVRFDVPLDELVLRNQRRRRAVPERPLRDLAATAAAVDDATLLAEGVDEVLALEALLARQPAIRLASAAISSMPPSTTTDVPVM